MIRPSDVKGQFIVYYGSTVIGQTFAVSAKQAVNNVRHNMMGDTRSQYEDIGMWEAIESTGGNKDVKNTRI